jgi:DNA-nicking Smr family endonuclease
VKRRSRDIDRDSSHGDDALSDADRELLARAMADVVPLTEDERQRVRPVADTRDDPPRMSPREMPPPSADDDLPESSYVAPGVDRRTLRRLRRQEFPVAARLDVHGLTAAEAVAQVDRFIDGSRHRRLACVCIVHGRGLHSEGNVAVLKMRVRGRLRHHRQVLAYTDAPPSDGGPGAVYVLLRK